jgi:NTP pyrophosphatase (non-canonical NTP hydrolase)
MRPREFTGAQREVFEWAITKGWEPDSSRTFGDECALLHSEVSEAVEAFRIAKFDDQTSLVSNGSLPKPEGVGSEFADVLVRLLHYSHGRGLKIDTQYPLPGCKNTNNDKLSFGDQCSIMHACITDAFRSYQAGNIQQVDVFLSRLYARLRYCCNLYGYDLGFEYRRKMDYNRTRAFRHGNRAM